MEEDRISIIFKTDFMKHTIYCFIAIITLASCSVKNNKIDYSTVFDKIDVSIYDGATNFYSLKILNSGKIYICINKHRESDIYYAFNIRDNELDSISSLLNKIKSTKIDTLYKEDCADCGSYRLIIKAKDVIISSKVENMNNSTVCLKDMNKLVSYLGHIARKSKSELNENFRFESKTREFYPTIAPNQRKPQTANTRL